MVCVLHGFSGQRAIWRLLSHSTFWFYPRFPVSDQAVYKRLASEGLPAMQTLFGQISMVLRERLAPFAQMHLAPFATAVMDRDETALDGLGAARLPNPTKLGMPARAAQQSDGGR